MINPFVLIPLYAYPSGSIWNGVFTQVANYPSLQFSIIINVDNGPGSATPDSTWVSTISKLNAYNNTKLLGYIPITTATRTLADVISDIDVYAGWTTHTDADIHMDGIFFDESPSKATTTILDYMVSITDYARSVLVSSNNVTPYIMLNPGTEAVDAIYNTADSVVAMEQAYSKFSTKSIDNIQTSHRAKSAVILHAYSGDTDTQTSVINSLVGGNIPGVYITDSASYMRLGPLFPEMVSALAEAATSVSQTSTTSTTSPTKTSSSTTSSTTASSTTTSPTTTSSTTTSSQVSTTKRASGIVAAARPPTTLTTSINFSSSTTVKAAPSTTSLATTVTNQASSSGRKSQGNRSGVQRSGRYGSS